MELPTQKAENGVYDLFLLLTLVLTVSTAHKELSFQGNGLQVYYITAEKNQAESYEFKLWLRTTQLTGMLMMIQNGGGSFTLVGMYEGRLRCMFLNDCKSPEKWQVATISDQSLSDGKWHKFGMYMTREMDNSDIQCQVDSSKPTNIKVNGGSAGKIDKMLLLGGLPNLHQTPELSGNFSCFPEMVNFSGCIADLQINFISSHGQFQQVNTSLAKQFGDVSARCTQARDSVVSISDKNSKILLVMKDDNRFNTFFEFQIRTRESRAFVGKIVSQVVTALFFLEEGKMKVSARFENISGHKGDFVDMTSSRISLSDNHWHKVTFNVAMEMGANLLINDELKAHHKISWNHAQTNLKSAHKGESHVTLRFGRSARKYPSFIGCLRDVYVNNHLANFSLHKFSKGITVGECDNSFDSDWPRLRKNKTRITTHLRSTMDTFTKSKYFESRAYKTTNKSLVTSPGRSNASENILQTVTPNINPRSKSNSRSISRTYSIAAAITVGLLIILIVMVYFLSSLRSRLQKRHNKQTNEENGDAELNNAVEVRDKDGYPIQPRENFANLRVPGGDQQSPINFHQHVSSANIESGINKLENYRSPRRLEQSPVKVWEERYLNHSPGKAAGSNFLTVPMSCYNYVHTHRTPIRTVRSQENVLGDINNIGPTNEYISLQKHGFSMELSNSNTEYSSGERRIATDISPQTPKRFSRIYSGHDSLPKPKKTSGLSWAYGARFIRHESSDTDCSDVDSLVIRTRPRNQLMDNGRVMVRPRQLKVLESSEDEQESRRAFSGNRAGRSRRLRTFTEETYKLYSLKEEEREIELDQHTANRLKVHCKNAYSLRGRNRGTSFVEAAWAHEDTVGIGAQARSLDGYTSSCPESINCLSEKEDKGLNIRRSKRLTTHYF